MKSTLNSTDDLLNFIDQLRVKTFSRLLQENRAAMGQYGTPKHIARRMASMFKVSNSNLRLLDAGAGVGSLTAAFVEKVCARTPPPVSIHVTAFELEPALINVLETNLYACKRYCIKRGIKFSSQIIHEDFIKFVVNTRTSLFAERKNSLQFNCAIQNPPYQKIRSNSDHKRWLRTLGIEVSNLYAAFISLTLRLIEKGGEIVAITPRSFCNGPYFQKFRTDFLNRASLRHIHVFNSRTKAFENDGVLQESVIVYSSIGSNAPNTVKISSSSGAPNADETLQNVAYENVVPSNNLAPFIHLITNNNDQYVIECMKEFSTSLNMLQITVSTGRVIDFRAKKLLKKMPKEGDAPLIYPTHLRKGKIIWPIEEFKKSNAIMNENESKKLLVPAGIYVLVKRFSSKEQKRRIEAFVFNSQKILPHSPVGFENHLNYFHIKKTGLDTEIAHGLACYLNSTMVDRYFRLFSGHTQVNATDLRALPYPTLKLLKKLGKRVAEKDLLQDKIDDVFYEEFFGNLKIASL